MRERQRVVVIEDANRRKEVSSSAIRWALHGLSLQPGDQLILLGVLHHLNTPMGYKSRVGSSSIFGGNQRIIEIEAATRKKEYENNLDIIQISKLYQTQGVEFRIEVAIGPSPKEVALISAQNHKATWVILDRQMKKDKKYFLKRLSCGISRMKRNKSIEQLRGPKSLILQKRTVSVSYDEMIPGSPDEDDLFSIEL
ncbi:hypothetical protein LWI29_025866 [Acer saccharum]|uniref:Uncharacterized protein n=1 Tax=Acer saccharum TaxID=4024 RepID=A0AA39T9K0_ACESA|nr:hypothetical protein LWI29_025866 [Acer saccharum]